MLIKYAIRSGSDRSFKSNNVHVVVERASAVVVDDLLARALPLPHGLEAAVPVEQLEDGHQLLELEHRLLQIRLQHVAEGGDAGGARVGLASDDL